jgi:hypothetical protein
VLVADLLLDPDDIDPLVDAVGRRFGSADRKLLLAQVARESIAAIVTTAVELWADQRCVVDLSAANVVLRAGDDRVEIEVCDPTRSVGSEAEMLDHLVDQVIGYPVEAGAVPPGQPGSVAAVAAIVATVRRLVRSGDRHLWGTAALAVVSTLARLRHALGEQADRDRVAVLGTRPDLARTLELVTVGEDDVPTFALRRTCCLLLKLPGGPQCGTCSLGDRDVQIARIADWHRASSLGRQGCDGAGGAPGTSSNTWSA